MSYDTESVFEVLAADDTQRRVASRRALALAHTRVESHLGTFLRGAADLEEFEARMEAVAPEFAAYVSSATEEMGHDKPEFIARSLTDHYARFVEAAGDFEVHEDEGRTCPNCGRRNVHTGSACPECGAKLSATREAAPNMMGMGQPAPQPWGSKPGQEGMIPPAGYPGVNPSLGQESGLGGGAAPGAADPSMAMGVGPQGAEAGGAAAHADPAAMALQGDVPQGQTPMMGAGPGAAQAGPAGVPQLNQQQAQQAIQQRDPMAMSFMGRRWTPEGKQGSPLAEEPWSDLSGPDLPWRDRSQEPLMGVESQGVPCEGGCGKMMNPVDHMVHPVCLQCARRNHMQAVMGRNPQEYGFRGAATVDTGDEAENRTTVSCPECGGDKIDVVKDEGKCKHCNGSGQVPHFGPSILDQLESSVHRAADERTAEKGHGNTDLGDPYPKIDKRLWTPETVKNPDPGSVAHPNRRKDILVYDREKNNDELTEIGEQTTKRIDLPSGTGMDESGYDPAMSGGRAPHTKTFGEGKHIVDPVTHDALS